MWIRVVYSLAKTTITLQLKFLLYGYLTVGDIRFLRFGQIAEMKMPNKEFVAILTHSYNSI